MIHPKIAIWLFCSILVISIIISCSRITYYNSEYLIFEKMLLDHPEKFDYVYDLLIKYENFRRTNNFLPESFFLNAIMKVIDSGPTSNTK